MSKQTKKRTCIIYNCKNEPYMTGLCEEHYKEDKIKKDRRDSAIRALHSYTINDTLPTNENLQMEFEQLCEWWHRVCTALNTNVGTTLMPLNEVLDAKEWCIILAQKIIDDELDYQSGKQKKNSFDLNREQLWNKFKNLEKGLTSNGLQRNND